jgi:hypothetical protein
MPSFENLGRLADALGVTTDFLLGRDAMVADNGVSPSGPTTDLIFSHTRKMKQDDLEILEAFAKMLAERSNKSEL